MVYVGHSATRDIDFHPATGSCCVEGTDHDSTDWMVLGTSAENLAEGWCMDEYYF